VSDFIQSSANEEKKEEAAAAAAPQQSSIVVAKDEVSSALPDGHVQFEPLSRMQLVRALWENTSPAAFFKITGMPAPEWSEHHALAAVTPACASIDYLCGRPIKISFSSHQDRSFDARL
jgi:hypothetical protein